MSITLEEARQLKEKLETEISERINTYAATTGLRITNLHLEEVVQQRIGQKTVEYFVTLEATL